MIRRSIAQLVLVLACLAPSGAFAQWSNEPAGSSVMVDCAMVSVAACGMVDVYGVLTYGSDASDPVSPSSVAFSTLGGGQLNGGSQVEYGFPISNEMFVGIVFKINSQYQGFICCANKTFFMRGPNTNGFFNIELSSPTAPTWNIAFGHNTGGGLDNSHVCAGELGLLGCFANVDGSKFPKDTFVKFEVYMKKSTTATSRDGVLKWWANGSLRGSYTTLNYPNGFNSFVWTETYGGMTDTVPNPRIYTIGHIRISAPNCGSACGGGGGGSDTSPPSQVTGVATSAIGSSGASVGWSPATDNVSVAGYQVEYCNGVGCTNFSNRRTTATTSISLTGLSPGTPYSVRVRAYDGAGNVSVSYSGTVSFTTLATGLPSMSFVEADSTGANVAWTGSPASIRVQTDTLNLVEPMTAFPVSSETIAHVQSRSVAGSGNSISLAYSSNNAAGNFLALRLTAVPSSVSISNCSDTRGNTWVPVPLATGGSGGHQAIRYAVNALAGANTVTCTLTGSATAAILDLFEKSGVDRSSPLDQSKLTQQVDPGTGTDAISSGSVTTTADGELILGGTLQVGSTVYSASSQFSGTQGPIWYYKDSSGTNLTWNGSYWAGAGYLGLWDTGGHPGNPLDAVRRWVAPADGSVRIEGTAVNYSGCGSNGTNLEIKKNGVTLWSQFVPQSGSYPYDISTTVVATDTIDFLIDNNGNAACDSTQFDPTITLGTGSGSGGTTTVEGTGFTLRHATATDSPSEDKVQSSAGPVSATFTGADALNDYITSIATFKPAKSSIRYSRNWPIGTTFVCMYPRDAAGNENSVSPGYKCDSVTASVDTTPPVRSSLAPAGTLAAGTTSAVISVVTNEAATCRYSTSAGVAYGSMVNALDSSANGLFYSKTVTGLSNGTTYTYYVRCQDVFLNANTSDSAISFSVGSVAGDVTAPSQVVGLQGAALNATQISLSWTSATDNIGVTGYEVYVAESGGSYTLGATETTTSTLLSGLSPNTLYLLQVRARDAVGNFGALSTAAVVLTPPSDVSSPSDVSGLAVSAVDFQALDVAWAAGTDDVGVASTNIEQCVGSTCTEFLFVAAVKTGQTTRFSGLTPQTTYRFRAKHADAAGNVSANYSPIVSGTTPAVPTGTVTAVCPCKHHR